MKIIITVSTYYPQSDGVQNVTQYLAEGVARAGHEVVVLTELKENLKKKEKINGVQVIRFNVHTYHGIHVGDKREYIKFVKEMSSSADALINVCLQTATTDLLLKELKDIPCKKILYMHGMHEFGWKRVYIKNFLDLGHKLWGEFRWFWLYWGQKKKIENYDLVIHLHEFDKAIDFFRKHYTCENTVIYNAAENIFFEEKRRITDERYAICVSRFDDNKNQKMLLEAYEKSSASRNGLKLILIGNEQNDYSRKLEKYIAENKELQQNVKILYAVSRKDIVEYVANSLFFIMSSKHEAFSMAIVEAMAAGIPFISTDVGVAKYLPGGAIAKDVSEMAFWIDLMFHESNIAELYGRAAQKYAIQNLTRNAVIKKFLDKVMQVCEWPERKGIPNTNN